MSVVSNASPLINLARIGQLELLHELYGEIYISYLDTLREAAGSRVHQALYVRVLQDAGEL
jgi:predicted nucleic acid-binding protein